jgi:hypothetical protein
MENSNESMLLKWPVIAPWKTQPFKFYQPKLDGYGVFIGRCAEESPGFVLGHRNTHFAEALECPKIANMISLFPPNSVAMAELCWPGRAAVATITGIKQRDPNIEARIFAFPRWGGQMPPDRVDEALDWHEERFGEIGEEYRVPYTRCIVDKTDDIASIANGFKGRARAENLEGYVLKNQYLTQWYKIKPVQSVDVFVVSYEISRAFATKGQVKTFTVGINISGNASKDVQELASVGSGFSQEQRREISKDPSAWIGRVMEVEYDCLTFAKQPNYDGVYRPGASLRFPRFKRWRDDKIAEDCTMDQF